MHAVSAPAWIVATGSVGTATGVPVVEPLAASGTIVALPVGIVVEGVARIGPGATPITTEGIPPVFARIPLECLKLASAKQCL